MSTRAGDPYAVLRVAAQYVARFRGALFVLKVSGALAEDPARMSALAEQIRLVTDFGIRLIVVHGAGSEIDRECDRRGIPVQKIGGRRITSPAVLEVVCESYREINRSWVSVLRASGLSVVGVFGQEGSLLRARPRPPGAFAAGFEETVSWGAVGDLETVDAVQFRDWIKQETLAVVAPLTAGPEGEILNSNADTVASALAAALHASKLIFLLGVPGLLRNRDDRTTVIPYADLADLAGFEASGMIQDGMIVKTRALESALRAGVESIHLVSGTDHDALVREVFTHEGSGTMIVARKRKTAP
ncbi:MAG: acetylglutamate kinase [Gammaproteobacteria bacterium]